MFFLDVFDLMSAKISLIDSLMALISGKTSSKLFKWIAPVIRNEPHGIRMPMRGAIYGFKRGKITHFQSKNINELTINSEKNRKQSHMVGHKSIISIYIN